MADENKSARHEEKWNSVKVYIPFLQELISYYKNSSQSNREPQLQKLTTMYDLLTNKRLNYDSLCKCEKVLQKLYETNPLRRELPKHNAPQTDPDTPASPVSPESSDNLDSEPRAAIPESVEKRTSLNDKSGQDNSKEKPPLSLDEIQRIITEKNESSNVRAAINDTLKVLKGARIPTISSDASRFNKPESPLTSVLSHNMQFSNDYWHSERETFDTYPHTVTNNMRPVSYNNIELTPGPSKSPPLYRRREDLSVTDSRIMNEPMDVSPTDVQSPPLVIKDPRLRKSAAFASGMPTPPELISSDPMNCFFPAKISDPRLNRNPGQMPPPPNDLPKCVAPNPNLPLGFPKRRLSICANQVIIEEIPPEPAVAFPARRQSISADTCQNYDQQFHNAPFVPPPTKPTAPALANPITPVYHSPSSFLPQQPNAALSFADRDPRRKHMSPGTDFNKPPQTHFRNVGPSNTPLTYAEYRRQKEMRETMMNDRNRSMSGDDQFRDHERKAMGVESTLGMVPNNNRVAAKAYAKPAKSTVPKERRFAPQLPSKEKGREEKTNKAHKSDHPSSSSSSYSHNKTRDHSEKDKIKSVPKSMDLFGEQLSQFDKMYRSGDFSKKSSKPNIDRYKIPKLKSIESVIYSGKHSDKNKKRKEKQHQKSPETTKDIAAEVPQPASKPYSEQFEKEPNINPNTKSQESHTKSAILGDEDLWDDDVPFNNLDNPKPTSSNSEELKKIDVPKNETVFQAPTLPAPRRIMTRRYSMAIEQKHSNETIERDASSVHATAETPKRILRRRNSIAVSELKENNEKEKSDLVEDEDVVKKPRTQRKRRTIIDDDDDEELAASAPSTENDDFMQSEHSIMGSTKTEPLTSAVTTEDASDNIVSSTTSESSKIPNSIMSNLDEDKSTIDICDSDSDKVIIEGNDSKHNTKEENTTCKDEKEPNTDNKAQLLAMLSKMLDEKKLKQIREIIESPSDKSISNEQEQDNDCESKDNPATASTTATHENSEKEKLNKKGKKNEVEKLNADIAEMFIRDGVLTAYGRRSCTKKPINSPKKSSPKQSRPGPSKITKPAPTKKTVELEPKLRNLKILVKRLNITKIGTEVHASSPSKQIMDSLEDDVVSIASSGVSVSPKSKKRKRNIWSIGTVKKKKKKVSPNDVVSPVKIYPPKAVTKNIHRDLHCSNNKSKDCALCSYTGPLTTIVQHYVRNHPLHEVYISRVPTAVASKLKKNPMEIRGKIHDQNISFQCIFCQEQLSKTKYNWKLHLASHTGEYRYKCSNCTIKSLTPCTYSHDSECSGSSMEVVNELLFEENHIYGYMCRLCHFVQLSQENMKTHLREEHDRQMTTKGTLQFSILNYAREEKPSESPKSQETIESDISMPELTPQVTNEVQQSDMSAFIPTANEEIESLRVLSDQTFISPSKPSIVDKLQETFDEIKRKQAVKDDEWEDIHSPTKEAGSKDISEIEIPELRRSLNTSEEIQMPIPMAQKKEPNDIFENKQTVSNVGYCKADEQVWYLCLVGGCKYSTVTRSEMYNHVDEEHSSLIWDGFCHLCTAQVIDDDNCGLSKEVKHMAVIHIKDRSAVDDLNTSSVSLLSNPIEDRPKLKLRRFSGDKLSIGQEQADAEQSPNLKPWLNVTTTKKRNHCLNMLEQKSLYCFYKCMATSCCFSTPLVTMMEKHLDNHELVGDATGSFTSRSWLECAYCETVSEGKVDLLEHLKTVHGSSTHQCAYCFYRSRDAYNVILHQKLHHANEKKQILVMDLVKKSLTTHEQEMLHRRRLENISSLICTVCQAKFCVLDAYMSHLKETHVDVKSIACQCCQEIVTKQKIPRHLLVHKIGIYECIFCQFGTDTMEAIQNHVCNKHPMEPYYCCVRFNKTPGKVMEATLKSLYDKAIEDDVFVCCPFTEEQLSYKSPDTKSNHDIRYNMEPTVIPLQLPPIRIGNDNILLSAQIPSSTTVEVLKPQSAVMVKNDDVIKIPMIASVSGGVDLFAPTTIPIITAVHGNYQQPTTPVAATSMPVISKVVGGMPSPVASSSGSNSMPIITRVEGGLASVATIRPVPSLVGTKIIISPNKSSGLPLITNVCSIGASNQQISAQDESLMLEAERIALEMIKDTGLPRTHLYRCIFKGCNASMTDGAGMKSHLMYTHLQAGQYACNHCKKQNVFSTIATFIQHLKTHEAQRVFCFVCDYKGSFPPDVMKHVKEVHKAAKPAMLYLNPKKNNPNNDIILFSPGVPSEAEKKAYYRKLIDLYNHKLQIALLQQKTHFTPEECESLPKQAIFSRTIFCSKCQYSTKVRQNMYRHLKGHLNDLPVSNIDPKNPVPCWGQGEKHFDRMRNPAASSQEDDDLIQSLCFVQENKRYICGAPDCRHLTINEVMLQNHLVTLHSDVKEYKCPHCPAVHVFAGQLNTVKVLDHLKLHDKELYRCSLCYLFLNTSKGMSQHITEKHPPNSNATLLVIRDGSTAGSASASTSDHEVLFKWKCDICKFKSIALAEMRTHMNETHNTSAKYRCSRCLYSCSKKALFATHFEKQHPGCEIVIISLYKAIDGDDSRADTTPLWRREANKARSIRGIMVEMDEDEDEDDNDEFVEISGLDSGVINTGITIRKRKSLEDAAESDIAAKRQKPENVSAIKAFKCGFRGCTYVDDFGAGIVSHFKTDHPDEKPSVLRNSMANPEQSRFDYFLKYACYYCIKKADTISELLLHWKQMHQIAGLRSQDKPFLFRASKIILCFYCRKGAQMPEMKSHYSVYHPGMQPIYLDFRNPKQCAECDFVMGNNRLEMVQHFAAQHKIENEYSRGWIDFLTDDILEKILKLNCTSYGCDKCAFVTEKHSDFRAHFAAAHPGQSVVFNEYSVTKKITYHCAYNNCKSQLTDEKSLAHHILFHVPVFKCCCLSGAVQCNVQFRTFTMLLQHFQTTHSNEDMRYALKTPEEYKQVLRMITLQFWNGFMMTLEDARQAGNQYGSNNGIFKVLNQLCQDAVLTETEALARQ